MKISESGLILPSSSRSKKVSIQAKDIDLLPSEEEKIYQCIVDEKNSFQCRQQFQAVITVDDFSRAVRAFSTRLMHRISDIGFIALVSADVNDEDNLDIYDDDSVEWHPKVFILSRIHDNDKHTDIERRQFEVRHGQADGKVGRLLDGKIWTDDPDSKKMFGFGD